MLAAWVRDRLWPSSDWREELARLRPEGERSAQRLYDLACATEACDPERGRALALYLDASRAGHVAARSRAMLIAIALRAHLTVAELALADGDLVTAGTAFLDAGFPDLAIEPLARFVDKRPPGASAMTEALRLEGVTALLALARDHRFDAEREVANAFARAQHATGTAAAAAYVHAERVARIGKLADRIPGIVAAAARACPDDPAVALIVETYVFEAANTDALLAHHRERFERSASPADYAERVRAAGVELIARNLQPGMGLRLLRLGLETSYDAQVPEIRGHIAIWELLRAHARQQDSTLELAPLIARALAAPLPEDDIVYLTRLGLEVAWREAADLASARPYAESVLAIIPDHPLALAFAREHAPELIPAPPLVSFSSPAPAARVEKPVSKATSRIPVIDQGQVKRVPGPEPTGSPRVTGRLALLRPSSSSSGTMPALGARSSVKLPALSEPATAALAPSMKLPALSSNAAASTVMPVVTSTAKLPAMSSVKMPAIAPSSTATPAWAVAAAHLARPRATSSGQQEVLRAMRAPSGLRGRAFPVPTRSTTGPTARAPRKILPLDVVIELPDGAFFTTVLRDVSTSGAFVVTKRSLEIDTVITLELRIPVPGSTHEASHRTVARVARRTGLGWGLAFLDPAPELVAALRAATG